VGGNLTKLKDLMSRYAPNRREKDKLRFLFKKYNSNFKVSINSQVWQNRFLYFGVVDGNLGYLLSGSFKVLSFGYPA